MRVVSSVNQTRLAQRRFHNANQETVVYRGEPIEWRVSGYGVAIQDDRVLLAKNEFEKYFDLPGGGVDLGETFAEALERESVEESGYLLRPGKLLHHEVAWFQHRSGKFFQTLRLYFWAETWEQIGEATDEEMIQVVWATQEDIESGRYSVDEVAKGVIYRAFSDGVSVIS